MSDQLAATRKHSGYVASMNKIHDRLVKNQFQGYKMANIRRMTPAAESSLPRGVHSSTMKESAQTASFGGAMMKSHEQSGEQASIQALKD